ncbi:hypothetical protein ES708_27609 [subsurface metagenome]
MEKGYYINKYGRKVLYGQELENLVVDEISLVSNPATKMNFSVIKNEGGEQEMEEEELKNWENVSEKEILTIRETIKILNKYDLTEDLKRAVLTLTKYFGGEEVGEGRVKKYNERCEWSQTQRILFGYNEDDLDMLNYKEEEVEKSTSENPFPSLAKVFNRNAQEERFV